MAATPRCPSQVKSRVREAIRDAAWAGCADRLALGCLVHAGRDRTARPRRGSCSVVAGVVTSTITGSTLDLQGGGDWLRAQLVLDLVRTHCGTYQQGTAWPVDGTPRIASRVQGRMGASIVLLRTWPFCQEPGDRNRQQSARPGRGLCEGNGSVRA